MFLESLVALILVALIAVVGWLVVTVEPTDRGDAIMRPVAALMICLVIGIFAFGIYSGQAALTPAELDALNAYARH